MTAPRHTHWGVWALGVSITGGNVVAGIYLAAVALWGAIR